MKKEEQKGDRIKAACIGAGVVGYSFALRFAAGGCEVFAQNRSREASEQARDRILRSLDALQKNGAVDREKSGEILRRIHFTASVEEAVTGAGWIQESTSENYEIKHKVVDEIERYADPDVVVASSTSGLLITEISEYAAHPERFVGGHPYNPPHLIPLVEVTKGKMTSDRTLEEAKRFYTSVGMEPVVLQKETFGFICNRLQWAMYRELASLVMNGVCSVEDADKAVTYGPGMRWGIMGPSLVFELNGGDGGVSGLIRHLDDSIALWLEDLAKWERFPEEWPEIVQKGVEEELKNRLPETGNTRESLSEYRDRMLISLLKLHGKL